MAENELNNLRLCFTCSHCTLLRKQPYSIRILYYEIWHASLYIHRLARIGRVSFGKQTICDPVKHMFDLLNISEYFKPPLGSCFKVLGSIHY